LLPETIWRGGLLQKGQGKEEKNSKRERNGGAKGEE